MNSDSFSALRLRRPLRPRRGAIDMRRELFSAGDRRACGLASVRGFGAATTWYNCMQVVIQGIQLSIATIGGLLAGSLLLNRGGSVK